jgi:hypothetical protein
MMWSFIVEENELVYIFNVVMLTSNFVWFSFFFFFDDDEAKHFSIQMKYNFVVFMWSIHTCRIKENSFGLLYLLCKLLDVMQSLYVGVECDIESDMSSILPAIIFCWGSGTRILEKNQHAYRILINVVN